MRVIRSQLLFLLLMPALLACESWKRVQWVEDGVPGAFSLQVPEQLTLTDDLHSDAPFQRMSAEKELFAIVRWDSLHQVRQAEPDFLLEDFLDLTIERLIKGLSDPQVPVAADTLIGPAPAYLAQISGFFKGEALQYQLAVIEGQSQLFQVLIWYAQRDAELLRPVAEKMLLSFREE